MGQPRPTREIAKLGQLLRDHRLQRGLSFKQLCEALGKEKGSVSRWERGIICPKPQLLLKWARLLELEPKQLFALAGYSEILPLMEGELFLSSEPIAISNLRHWSKGLADFATSEGARELRVSWQEIRQLRAVPLLSDKTEKSLADWQDLLLILRRLEGKAPDGQDNGEEALVWANAQLMLVANPLIE